MDSSVLTPEQSFEALLTYLLREDPAWAGYRGKIFSVGGFVRDQVLGRKGGDFDLVCEQPEGGRAVAHQLDSQFAGALETVALIHPRYPIWRVKWGREPVQRGGKIFHVQGAEVDLAPTQSEGYPNPRSRQREVSFGSLEEDCRRRDFTVNMLFRDLTTGELRDPSGVGLSDLQEGILRHHPERSGEEVFFEDPLRLLRLLRFEKQLGFKIHPDTATAAFHQRERLNIVPANKLREELEKMLPLPLPLTP